MDSITKLFSDLCESHMVGFPWKAGLGSRNPEKNGIKQTLKRLAYDTLFVHLFQEEVRRQQPNSTRLPVKNKMLMLSFNLRMGGMSLEAERLEELVEQLETSLGAQASDFSAVLELLVDLAGTGPPQLLPPKRDYFQNNKYVGRNPCYKGYDYYDVSMFEADLGAVLAHQECEISNVVHRTLQIMEAAPGTGLPSIGFFSHNYPTCDKFERETRVSLFGALVHSRTNDMEIKLDLPPVPDSADLSGLAIKVPQSIDQSEDEGFQSASNMTPDSQSEPSMTPDIDLWEAVLTYGPSKRRCWERIGCPPGKKEDPYLTEAGREAFDKLYKLHEAGLQILNNTFLQSPQHVMLRECELVKDVLNALIGVVSSTFCFNQSLQALVVKQGIYISGTSPENISSLLAQIGEYGTYYTRLSRFSLQTVLDSSQNKGLVFQAFTSGLRKYLQYYRACVLSTPGSLTLLTISFLFRKLGRQLRYLAELCCIGTLNTGASRGCSASFPTGVKLLSYLYKEALENSSNENYPVLLSLLKTSCEPYTRFIYDWVYSGVFRDVCGEFMIQVNQDFLGFRDKRYWTHGYILISKEVEDCVPVFLKHLANEIYICGKTINLLKLCCPKHYICWSDIPVPRISVTFSLEELKEMEKDCAVYVARMERIARYSGISKEQKDLQTEIAKQELINQARETAERLLESFKDRQLSEKNSQEQRKRELFLKLKEQYEKYQERRLTAKQEEDDDDFSYARELRDREKRLKALEEELELKAKQELIEHYSKLSEEATQKEQKALWKLQRHKLETARLNFFLKDEKHIQDLLKQFPMDQTRRKQDILPQAKTVHDSEPSMSSLLEELSTTAPQPSTSNVILEESKLENPISVNQSLNLHSGNTNGEHVSSTLVRPPFESDLTTTEIDIADFLPTSTSGQQKVEVSGDNFLMDDALKDIGSDLTKGTEKKDSLTIMQGDGSNDEYDFSTVLKPVAFSHVSQGHITIGDNLSNDTPTRPRWNIHGHASDANIKIGDYVPIDEPSQPKPNQHGHSSDSQINIGQYASDVEQAQPQWNLHGHVYTGHIKVGEYSSDFEASKPRQNIHGHVSDANIKIGDYVPTNELSQPKPNQHGHSSDSQMNIGQYASDVEQAQPQCNLHGHVSTGHIKVGEYSSDFEASKPSQNIHGHASDANIKIGDYVPTNELSQPKPNQHGHSSDSHINIGQYASDVEQAQPQCNLHGHVSTGHIKVGEYSSDFEASKPSQNIHGHASDANIKIGDYVPTNELSQPKPNQHGHSSDSQMNIGQYASDVEQAQPQWNLHGHVSTAHIKVGEYSSDFEASKPSQNIHGHASDANIKIGDYVPTNELSRPKPNQHGHSSDSHKNIGQYTSDVEQAQPQWNLHGHVSTAHIKVREYSSDFEALKPSQSIHGNASDANIKIGDHVPTNELSQPKPNQHGHSSDSHINIGQYASDVEQAQPQCNLHGHVSTGHIKVGEYSSDFEASKPSQNIHGHASDANIKIGDYVPTSELSQPKPNQHGHSSDSHINIGQYASDVEQAQPQCNLHGHVSTGHIKVGEYSSDFEASKPRQNIHGHASESNIKVGENVSDVNPSRPRWNIHGHASDANIKIGENVSEIVASRPRWNVHGHASQSHIQTGELVSDVEQSKPRSSVFGHASQSSIKIGDWSLTGGNEATSCHISEYGHSSDSTIQNVLYGERPNSNKVLKNIEEESEELEKQPSENTESSDVVTVMSPSLNEEGNEVILTAELGNENIENKKKNLKMPQDLQRENSAIEAALSCDNRLNLACPSDAQSTATRRDDDRTIDTWEKEQDYLQALADRYCLEKYQDSYELMSEPPVLHLLSHVMPREFSFPMDRDIQSATDETSVQLIELLSIPVLMKYSVTAPMVSHVSLVNKAVVDYYFVELKMEKHFEAIRHFLLMEDGEFAQSLSDLLFEKLGSGHTPSEMLTPLVLNSILNKALQYSLHGDSHLASNLSFALKYIPEMFTPTAPDTLGCLELKYKVDWPLNIVITESCVNKYNKIFSFLLQLKHMVWTLRDVWFHLKRTALVNQASNSVQCRQLQLFRHEMQHFVKVIQGYIANQILHVTWSEFRNKLSTVSNLEEIHLTHAEYLNKALFRGLLTEKAGPLMNIIHSIFSLILKFRIQLISQSWTCDTGKQMAVHPNFGLMQQSYNTFKYYSDFLFEVLTKLVNRGYQPHLEDFLLRINFNSYYKES
ncbi:gamma-tubulin complex component 6 [Discoglossus pictus]